MPSLGDRSLSEWILGAALNMMQGDLAAAQNRSDRDAIAIISRDLRYWDSRRSPPD
jgi:hypothetical protein